jgi:hypothetical protein
MIRIAAAVALGLVLVSPAHSEQVSVRCTETPQQRPDFAFYFATFDVETKKLIFETTLGGTFRGELTSVDDERIEFWIKVIINKMHLVFDRRRNQMIFPGFPASVLQRELVHPCQFVPVRTVLARYDNMRSSSPSPKFADPPQQPQSLRCIDQGHTNFLTFDRATKKVILEIGQGATYWGEIQGDAGHRIALSINDGTKDRDLTWDDQSQTLTWEALRGAAASGPMRVNPCVEIKTRTLLDAY